MNRSWVVNASPIITLARAGRLELLLRLCPKPDIPPAVAREIMRGREADPAREWMAAEGHAHVCRPAPLDARVVAWDLGEGESEVLSFALTRPGSEVVLDDRAARNCGLALGLRVRGALGIVILAKREGLIPLVAPVFAELARAGLRLDDAVMAHALGLAGEATQRD